MSADASLPADDPAPPSPGEGISFGHFVVPRRADGGLWELGRGAMGVTYRAFDTSLRTEVALKVVAAALVQEENALQRFQREARAAAKIRHPNVASVFHLGEQGGEFFYAMEFIAGRSLESLLKESRGPLPMAVAVGLAAQAAAGLNAAHRCEVVHRDLKPANLMLLEADALDHEDERTRAAGRQLKVIDFGLARSFGTGREEESFVTQTSAGFIGTPAYASPEQCAGAGNLDGRSDLYSLGVILWQMLAGRLPFTGNWQQVLGKHQFQPPPFEQLENLPTPLVELLKGLLIKDSALRQPQTARELRTALDRLLRTTENAVPGEPAAADDSTAGETRADTTSVPVIGTTLAARYRLGQEMGQGDGGRLFLAADNSNGRERPVAIKLLPPERAAESGFLQKTAAALDLASRHPHPVILAHPGSLETSGGAIFYVREWAEGFSLLELLRTRGNLRTAEVFRLLDALPSALDFAAEAGFPLLEASLHKLFVTPATAGSREDWPGLRSRPVKEWPAFTLRFNPLSFPPAASTADAELTRVENRSAPGGGDPVLALARLTRELLGGDPKSFAPLSALSGEANAVLGRAFSPTGGKAMFKTSAAFWETLRAAAGLSVKPTSPEQETVVEPISPSPPPQTTDKTPVLAPEPVSKGQGKKIWLSGLGLLLLIAAGIGVWRQAQPDQPPSPAWPTSTPQPTPTSTPQPTPTSTPQLYGVEALLDLSIYEKETR